LYLCAQIETKNYNYEGKNEYEKEIIVCIGTYGLRLRKRMGRRSNARTSKGNRPEIHEEP
jgi:hypothetical protein